MEKQVVLNEVGPRDWRFSHRASPGTDEVFETIRMLESAGIERVEIGASVNYDKYPFMKDTFELLSRLRQDSSGNRARYSVYVGPYEKNYPRTKITQLLEERILSEDPGMPDELSFSISASEKRNTELYGLSGNKVLEQIKRHVEEAKEDGVKFFRGYVSAAFGYKNTDDCPIGGVIGLTQLLFSLGCYEVALGDSRGHASPREFLKKWNLMKSYFPLEKIALHFHEDYYLNWETDVVQVLMDGVNTFDTSIMDLPKPVLSSENHAIVFEGNIPPNASTEIMVSFIDDQVNSHDYPFREKIGSERISTGLDYDKIKLAGSHVRKAILSSRDQTLQQTQ
jgi:hydroxymethylglutaryl-CoA lyase